MRRALARLLDAVRNPAVGQHREALERERRSRAATHEPFASDLVVGADVQRRVEVETLELRGAAPRTLRDLIERAIRALDAVEESGLHW